MAAPLETCRTCTATSGSDAAWVGHDPARHPQRARTMHRHRKRVSRAARLTLLALREPTGARNVVPALAEALGIDLVEPGLAATAEERIAAVAGARRSRVGEQVVDR